MGDPEGDTDWLYNYKPANLQVAELPASERIIHGLDDALEKLKWCRTNLSDPRVSITVAQLEESIGYLALAMDWTLAGDTERAEAALRRADWKARVRPYYTFNDITECG